MKKNLFYRGLSFRGAINKDDRTVNLCFSSEAPAKRWFGTEILLHGSGNVDLSRLKALGAALMNHNPAVIVGPLKNVRIENKRGKAKVVFDEDEDGNKAFGKVQSGSLKGVSVGYTVQKFREVLQNEDYTLPDGQTVTGPAMIAEKWTPHEISLTSIPLDSTVGVGRALTRSFDGIEIKRSNFREEKGTMNRHRPLIDDPNLQERLQLFNRTARLLGGHELQSRVIDAGIGMTKSGIDETAMARVLNDKLCEIESTAKGHRGTDGLNFRLQDVSTEDFCRSIESPLLIVDPSVPKKVKKTTDRQPVRSFDGIQTKDFISSICKPSVSF